MDFIWSFKKPHLPHCLLMASKDLGGLAVPDRTQYYDVTILSMLLKHCNEDYIADWKDIEDHAYQDKSFFEVLWLTGKNYSPLYILSLLCLASLKVRDRLKHLLIVMVFQLRPFLGQPWFPPDKELNSFQVWCQNVMTRFMDVAPKGTLLSKGNLEGTAGCSNPWLEYF